jgi:hypothetical protein
MCIVGSIFPPCRSDNRNCFNDYEKSWVYSEQGGKLFLLLFIMFIDYPTIFGIHIAVRGAALRERSYGQVISFIRVV